MIDTGRTDYQATYRRSERTIPRLLLVVVLFAAGLFSILSYADSRDWETLILGLAAVTVVVLLLILASTFWVHHWTVEPEGVYIHEQPIVPSMGLPRRAILPFAEIAALRRVESGFDHLIEIVTRDGRRYRMPQASPPNPRRIDSSVPAAELVAFAASIRAAAARAGCTLQAPSEALSFWNTGIGLALLAILFAFSLAIAGAVAWALWDGLRTTQPRQGEMAAILILLPLGAGYLLWKSVRRRRAVLSASQSSEVSRDGLE